MLHREIRRIVTGRKYYVAIDITDKCNLQCEHCYAKYSYIGKEDAQWEPLSIWEERFQQFKQDGVIGVGLVGGEPTLRLDVVMLAQRYFPNIGIITNGVIRIPPEFNHYIFLSVDGLEATNDRLRGQGTFRLAMENYRGDKRVIINITIMKENYLELEELIKTAQGYGFHGLVCNIYIPAEGSDASKIISPEDRKIILVELRRVKRLYPRFFLMNDQMLDWYEKADHSDYCRWGSQAEHYDAYMNRRRCFAKLDCHNCGCFAGAFLSILNLKNLLFHPSETLRILRLL